MRRFDVLVCAGATCKTVEAGCSRERADELAELLGPHLRDGVRVVVETDSGIEVDGSEEE